MVQTFSELKSLDSCWVTGVLTVMKWFLFCEMEGGKDATCKLSHTLQMCPLTPQRPDLDLYSSPRGRQMLILQAGKLGLLKYRSINRSNLSSHPTHPSELQLASRAFQFSTCFLAAIFIPVLKMFMSTVPLGTLDQKIHVTRKLKMKQKTENVSLGGFKRDSFEYFELL